MGKSKNRQPLQLMLLTNADDEATKGHLLKENFTPRVKVLDTNPENPSGRCSITFPDGEHSPILLYNNGKIQLTYRSKKELKELRNLLPRLIIAQNDDVFVIQNEKEVPNYLKQRLDAIDSEIRFENFLIQSLDISPDLGDVYDKALPFINSHKKILLGLLREREELFPTGARDSIIKDE